jgi:hypothetical protein
MSYQYFYEHQLKGICLDCLKPPLGLINSMSFYVNSHHLVAQCIGNLEMITGFSIKLTREKLVWKGETQFTHNVLDLLILYKFPLLEMKPLSSVILDKPLLDSFLHE